MTPSRTRRRRLAVAGVGLAVLLAVPVAVNADPGRGDGSKPEGSKTDVSTTSPAPVTTVEVPAEPSTSAAVTTTPAPTVSLTGRAKDIARFLGDLATMLENAKITAEVRDGILPRVRAMGDAVVAGLLPTQADLQALSAEVLAAVGRSSGQSAPTTSSGSTPVTTLPPTSPTPVAGQQLDPVKVSAQLDGWAARVATSSLREADKTALLTAIDGVRGLAAAGTLKPADLVMLQGIVTAALERARSAGVPGDATATSGPGSTGATEGTSPGVETKRPTGKGALDAAIATVTNSPLPDAVKQNILGVLARAKLIIENPSLAPGEVADQLRQLHDAHQAERLSNAVTRLAAFSQKIAVLAFDAGTSPGAGDMIVQVHDKLAQANELLASAAPEIATVKAAWKLLHEARTIFQRFLETAS